ncbi:MAG: hypothetical protein C4K60_12430 [Ideonella sp. MAG2]|nr:MAG: hypothetical protein C4K60_12430 [Ideonella sp. MAG2]
MLSPGDGMGWGQIGDAWRAGTPVIAYRQHYELRPGDNCLLAPTVSAYIEALSSLRQQPALRETLAANGRRDVLQHRVSAVAQVLAGHLRSAVSRGTTSGGRP